MKWKCLLCLALAFAMLASAGAETVTLVVPLFFESKIPEDVEAVNEALNRLTEEKIGVRISLVPLLRIYTNRYDTAATELELMYKQGLRFDIINDSLHDTKLMALDDLLESDGAGIIEVLGSDRLSAARENGKLYRLPSANDYVSSAGIAMRKDILDKYGIDPASISSLADLDALYDTLHELEPDLKLVCGYTTHSAFHYRYYSARLLPGTVFCLSEEDPNRFVNFYDTQEYREIIDYVRKWYLEGYMPENMALQNVNASELVKAGLLFSYTSAYKPDINHETSVASGMDMVVASLMDPIVSPASQAMRYTGIAADCAHPREAMQFINLLYTDPDVVNLLYYGIEGMHYRVAEDGTIDVFENAGYVNTMPWLLPNQLITNVRTGEDPQLWVRTKEFNDGAQYSPMLGFSFDDSAVAEQNAMLLSIANSYSYGLGSGQLNPDVYLPRMLAEMQAAGISDVQEALQAQYNAWRRSRKEDRDEDSDRG